MCPATLFRVLSPPWSHLTLTIAWQTRPPLTHGGDRAVASLSERLYHRAERRELALEVCLTPQPYWLHSPVLRLCRGVCAQFTQHVTVAGLRIPRPLTTPGILAGRTAGGLDSSSVLTLRADPRLLPGKLDVQDGGRVRGETRALDQPGRGRAWVAGPRKACFPQETGRWTLAFPSGPVYEFLRRPGVSLPP